MRKAPVVFLLLMLLSYSTEAFPCSVVQPDVLVVFNKLEGSVLQYGQTWSGGTVALYSGWDYANKQQTKLIREVPVSDNGHFDLGTVPEGHYTLIVFEGKAVKTSEMIAAFNDARPLHTWMLINYEQMTPDCKHMTRTYATTMIPYKAVAAKK